MKSLRASEPGGRCLVDVRHPWSWMRRRRWDRGNPPTTCKVEEESHDGKPPRRCTGERGAHDSNQTLGAVLTDDVRVRARPDPAQVAKTKMLPDHAPILRDDERLQRAPDDGRPRAPEQGRARYVD